MERSEIAEQLNSKAKRKGWLWRQIWARYGEDIIDMVYEMVKRFLTGDKNANTAQDDKPDGNPH